MFNLSVKTYLDQSVYSQSMLQNQGLITSPKIKGQIFPLSWPKVRFVTLLYISYCHSQ